MPPLVPCIACQRHVYCSDSICPFCAAALPNDLDQTLVPLPQRERGARPVLAPAVIVALAASTIGCGATATKYGGPPVMDDAGAPITVQSPVPAYGAPPPTAAPTPVPQANDPPQAPAYGAPPPARPTPTPTPTPTPKKPAPK